MATIATAKVTLHNGLDHVIHADDPLVVVETCADISDIELKSSNVKTLERGTTVIVKDISNAIVGRKTVRVTSAGKLYYIEPKYLTLISLL